MKMNKGIIVSVVFAVLLVDSIDLSNAIEEDYIDSVLNMLLSNDVIETATADAKFEGDEPYYSDGIWRCGDCVVLDDSKLVYSEVSDVDTNSLNDDQPIVVQVGLNLEMARCMTVVAGSEATVRRETGSCASGDVTLAVYNARHFTVNVYGASN